MVRPDEKQIWSFLEGIAPEEVAEEVVEWLSSEEGRVWLSVNSSRMFTRIEKENECGGRDIPSGAMLDRIHAGIRRRRRRARRHVALWRVAAVLVPVAFLGLIWAEVASRLGGSVFSKPETVSEMARPGERKVLVFQDGTKVHINAGAVMEYPRSWRLDRREVSLEGEAYFEVAANRKRPFTVNVFGAKIKVLGTTFNVKAYPEDSTISIALIGGSISFEADGQEYLMSPSQLLTYDRTDKSVRVVNLDHPDSCTLWKENIMDFRNDSLSDVVEVLGRWYDVEFDVTDRSLLSRKFTFRTVQLPLRSLLDEMEYISDLRFDIEDGVVTVSRK